MRSRTRTAANGRGTPQTGQATVFPLLLHPVVPSRPPCSGADVNSTIPKAVRGSAPVTGALKPTGSLARRACLRFSRQSSLKGFRSALDRLPSSALSQVSNNPLHISPAIFSFCSAKAASKASPKCWCPAPYMRQRAVGLMCPPLSVAPSDVNAATTSAFVLDSISASAAGSRSCMSFFSSRMAPPSDSTPLAAASATSL